MRRLFCVIHKQNPLVTNRLCAHKTEPKANSVIATQEGERAEQQQPKKNV